MNLPDVAPNSVRVLVVGSGGREHALSVSLSASPYVQQVICTPGNAGISDDCRAKVGAEDIEGIVQLVQDKHISFVVIGPEVPLVDGLADRLNERGVLTFGPTSEAALLEGSKVFAKKFMEDCGIPTAEFGSFDDPMEAKKYIARTGAPVVVKADGLAAGKGVTVARTIEEANAAVDDILVHGKFGPLPTAKVLIEEFLDGEEVSFFAVLDGNTALPLASAQDHKAAFDGDTGPNTGGMGAYSPAPICDALLQSRIMEQVVTPTMQGMKRISRDFRGVLFCGLMVDPKTQNIKVLEYNVRFGDPECQVLCTRMKSDMFELLYRTAKGTLGDEQFALEWHPFSAIVVVLAAKGYPGSYRKGTIIGGVDAVNDMEGVTVFHAGTARADSGHLVASGGRVLGVTATAGSIQGAKERAYEAISRIEWPDGFCRSDIGWRALARESKLPSNV